MPPQDLDAHLRSAAAAQKSGRVADAIAHYRAALRLKPDHPGIPLVLGMLLAQARRFDEALPLLERACRADPRRPDAWMALGTVLGGSGRAEDAAQAFRQVLRLQPGNASALVNLGGALRRSGQHDAAEDAYRQALAAQPRLAAAHFGLGTTLAARQRLEQAEASFRSAGFEPAGKSTVGGHQTGELLDPADPLMARLGEVIRGGVEAYMRHLRTRMPGHPYTASLPQKWKLGTWAVVLHSQGHQGPHFHPDGYISGVYYVSLPADMGEAGAEAGAIEFGRTDSAFGGTQAPMVATVAPQEGLMLLFPSYLYHRTLPFRSAAPRISVAFDVLPTG